MAITYQQLVNVNGTIFNKKTGKGYSTPAELATDLGIQPHQIDWTKIQQEKTLPAITPTPTPTPTPSGKWDLVTLGFHNQVQGSFDKDEAIAHLKANPAFGIRDPSGKIWTIDELRAGKLDSESAGFSTEPTPSAPMPSATPQEDIFSIINELLTHDKLFQVWSQRPDLQQAYDSSGKGISQFEGDTLESWAIRNGWKENPTELNAYKPQNIARAAYKSVLGRDPLDPNNPDPGVQSWISAIANSEITSFQGLQGLLKVDTGGEFTNLSVAERAAIKIDAYLPPERPEDVIKFSDFFKEEEERTIIDKQVEDFYTKQFNDFIEGQEIQQNRLIEDTSKLTKELEEEEEENLSDLQKQFRITLQSTVEGYGVRGLAFSSIRREAEAEVRESLEKGKERLTERATKGIEAAELQKKRTLEDIAREKRLQEEEITREKAEAKEIRAEQKRSQALTELMALRQGTLRKEELGITI